MPRLHRFINKFQGRSLLIALSFFLILGCTSREEKEFQSAQSDVKSGNFQLALESFDRIILTTPNSDTGIKAAREGARIAFFEAKDFNLALKFYRQIILTSTDTEERILSQKQIVAIYFDHLNDYQKGVIEINKLIPMLPSTAEKTEYKMKLARAYYYQNNFMQAENEVDEFLTKEISKDLQFDMYFLKGNINLAQKNLIKASEIFKKMMADFPERSLKENIGLTLSVCYEEMKDYKAAIETLEKVKASHAMPEYIDIRINRLTDRLKNQPGAKGRYRK